LPTKCGKNIVVACRLGCYAFRNSSGSSAMFAAICVSHFVFRLAEDVTGLQKSS